MMGRLRYVVEASVVCATMAIASPGAAQVAPPVSTALPARPAPAPAPGPSGSVGGMGDVNLYPKRVVLTDRNRVASIGLYNRAASPGEYDITVSDMMMTPDGRLVDIASVQDPAQAATVKGASGFVRWSPHHVSLPGSESQMVRVMTRLPPDLPPGEYRTHFSVVSVPEGVDGLSIDDAVGTTRSQGIGVRIVPRFGIAIPIIIRVGNTTLNLALRNLAVVTNAAGARAIQLTIGREGTRSAFGDIAVMAPGVKQPIALIKGLGVYTEVAERTVEVAIDPIVDRRLYAPGARLTVIYTDDDAAPGQTLAKQEFEVP